jgi:hypothetical protein
MSKARDLGDLLDTDGDVVSGSLDNVPTPSKTSVEALGIELPAANLTGSIANARIPESAVTQHVSDPITKSTSEPAVDTNPSGGVGTAWLRTTTGEMYCCTDATTGANVWTNMGDGTGGIPPLMEATGGIISTDGNYKVHIFNTGANFTVTTLGDIGTVEYLVVAGGGGGNHPQGAGGGAGGYRAATGFSVTASTYTITVGAGGANEGFDGADSIFSTITSTGGGAGGSLNGGSDPANTGGSGGGGSGDGSVQFYGAAGNTPSTSPSQGNAGGNGKLGSPYPSGGGGGSGAVGAAGNTIAGQGGVGGVGTANDIITTGTDVYYSGGGGGGGYSTVSTGGAGGNGGGGTGGQLSVAGTSGSTNKGGGGGGSGSSIGGSGAGGSGIVIIRYKFQ